MEIFTLLDMPNVFADAMVTDDYSQVLFMSLWGQDTALQELLARLTLSSSEGGLQRLNFKSEDQHHVVVIGSMDELHKHTGRIAKNSVFHGLSQLWIYDDLVKKPDRANRSYVLLQRPGESEQDTFWRLWQAARELCYIPLLDEWHTLISHFRDRGWIQHFSGIGVDAYRIDLSNAEVETVVTKLVRSGYLSLITLSKAPELRFAGAA